MSKGQRGRGRSRVLTEPGAQRGAKYQDYDLSQRKPLTHLNHPGAPRLSEPSLVPEPVLLTTTLNSLLTQSRINKQQIKLKSLAFGFVFLTNSANSIFFLSEGMLFHH